MRGKPHHGGLPSKIRRLRGWPTKRIEGVADDEQKNRGVVAPLHAAQSSQDRRDRLPRASPGGPSSFLEIILLLQVHSDGRRQYDTKDQDLFCNLRR
jgi:hypothetical protein